MRDVSLFDSLIEEEYNGWRPKEPPQIASRGIKRIELDTETTGLRWFDGDLPIGISICLPDGTTQYLPWGHRGGNLDEAVVKRWAQRELRDLHITNQNVRFDIHQLYAWGVDLEAQNCTVSDTSHYAALLDDHRQAFNLDILATDFLGEGKLGKDLDKTRMASYHAGEVDAYARKDVELVHRLRHLMEPMLEEQDLGRVVALENAVIYPVCEMERNGAPMDHELLDRWLVESKQKYEQCLTDLSKMVGFVVDPKKPQRLWEHLNLPVEYLESGRASFTDAIVKAQAHHPAIALMRYAGKLASLRSKYLVKYKNSFDKNGIVRYALHQLRAQKDPNSDYKGEAGTVTGRFSSTAITDDVGLNIQQEMKASRQRAAFGFEEDDDSHDDELFIVRQLRIPPPGREWLSADADQMEYRIFTSYANNQKVIDAYRENPDIDFHDYMTERIRVYKPDIRRKKTKDLNFAYVYGAGLVKQALMMGDITAEEYNDIKERKDYSNPKLDGVREIRKIYAQELPEVESLLALASHIAKPKCDKNCYVRGSRELTPLHQYHEHKGYVRTILGRRSRFPKGSRLHKAFNSIDQGTGADIMKQKLVEVHRERKNTGFTLRYTVHDELDGDCPPGDDGAETQRRISEILNHQSFPELKVPITWSASRGRNWKECE